MIPVLARTRIGIAAARGALPAPVVLVPTMGALHPGHRALMAKALQNAQPGGSVVLSVFVNPLQFGPGSDLERYPRDLDRDLAVCAEEGVAVVFAPDSAQMYPDGQQVTVSPGAAGQLLEGQSRPGFFGGVLTAVLTLFHLVKPDIAVFGEKDAQQLAVVRRMTADLNVPVRICSVPTVRDPDGLAISSRNAYLSAAERGTALALPRAMQAGAAAAGDGAAAVLAAAQDVLDSAAAAEPALVTDYLALADPVTFAAVDPGYRGPALLLAAAVAGQTRLIDNVPLLIGGPH